MQNTEKSQLNTILNLDFKDENSIWLTSSVTLRKIIGILGMALPFLLFVSLYMSSGLTYPLQSISHYYFTRVSSIFVIVISLMAIFLIVYKGKEPVDFYMSLIAGIFALLLVLFPTSNITDICCDINKKYSVTNLTESGFRITLHYISAAIFLLCLSFMSLFLFTRSDKSPEKRGSKKILRNRIYRICGVLMIIAVLIIFVGGVMYPTEYYDKHQLTFWMETVAVESFGISWLIKGKTLFKD